MRRKPTALTKRQAYTMALTLSTRGNAVVLATCTPARARGRGGVASNFLSGGDRRGSLSLSKFPGQVVVTWA
jgi:hypothetical protein